ncbi:MAG: hypothetical protein C0410_10505 [Anaerolinea sp.]|nr:hypothetical protein [Anaerolinea sp.]
MAQSLIPPPLTTPTPLSLKRKNKSTAIIIIGTIVGFIVMCIVIVSLLNSLIENTPTSAKTTTPKPTKTIAAQLTQTATMEPSVSATATQSLSSDNVEVKMVQAAPEWILIQSSALTEIQFEDFQNQVFGARVKWKLKVDEVGNVIGYDDEVYISCYPYPEITSIGTSYVNIYGISRKYGASLSKGDIITADCTITKFNNLANAFVPTIMLENCTVTK